MDLIEEYLAGPRRLREAVAGMTDEQLDAQPVPGKMSTRQVVCHIADFEPIYADRIKWVLAEDNPLLPGGDPDRFAARLAYDQRDVAEELQLIELVRSQLARILRATPPAAFQRTGQHTSDGPISAETLLQRIISHIPHHVQFIEEKRKALGI